MIQKILDIINPYRVTIRKLKRINNTLSLSLSRERETVKN